ncbi:LLM class flavin-dependent oxidoreductase [Gammaproteobacteria bacterium]|nr:LLM class flavin-dependent oxidoreductase [Gammaproteobacteria bacterium]
MRFGIFDHMEFRSGNLAELYEERLRMLEFADEAGFWCYHKAEHHFIRLDAAPSGTVFLAAASQRTHRIRLGSLVLLLPFYEPLRLIEEVCMLDHLSGGRLELGVGKGISPAEHTLWGKDPETARERFEEAFEILRTGLADATFSYSGDNHEFDKISVPHRPLQEPRPAFWYPGNVDYAGKHRLNTITAGPPEAVKNAMAHFHAQLLKPEADWNPGVREPVIGVTLHVYLASSTKAAIARVHQAYPAYHRNLVTLFKRYDIPFTDPSLGGNTELALTLGVLVAAAPEDAIAQIEHLIDETGIEYLTLSFAWGDLTHQETMDSIRLFAEEVMPHFNRSEPP